MYSKAFRALMVKKMADPDGPSQMSIAKEIGVSRSTLYRWASEIDTVDVVNQPGHLHLPIQCRGFPT